VYGLLEQTHLSTPEVGVLILAATPKDITKPISAWSIGNRFALIAGGGSLRMSSAPVGATDVSRIINAWWRKKEILKYETDGI
jgi:hypothetical protein